MGKRTRGKEQKGKKAKALRPPERSSEKGRSVRTETETDIPCALS